MSKTETTSLQDIEVPDSRNSLGFHTLQLQIQKPAVNGVAITISILENPLKSLSTIIDKKSQNESKTASHQKALTLMTWTA